MGDSVRAEEFSHECQSAGETDKSARPVAAKNDIQSPA
jgi:hypothetical protein